MFNFNGITHLLQCPNGRFTYVGSVPLSLHKAIVPTPEGIMGGRVINGKEYKTLVFDTAQEAIDKARAEKVNMCDIADCACRKYF